MHGPFVTKPLAAAIVALVILAGCNATAQDHAQQDKIDAAVAGIMCASSASDRQVAISNLGNLLDDYQGHDDDDSRSKAVDAAIDAFTDTGCGKRV